MRYIALTTIIILTTFGCASREGPVVKFEHDVVVNIQGEPERQIKVGESLTLTEKPFFVSARGREPVMLIPVLHKNVDISLNLPKSAGSAAPSEESIDVLLRGVYAVRRMIASSQYSRALAKVKELEVLYPGVKFLKLLKAGCFVALGDKKKAIEILRDGASNNLNAPEEMEFLQELEQKGGG